MKAWRFMVIAGEASGDTLAAELVRALPHALARLNHTSTHDHQPLHANLAPEFFGAGGRRMAEAGVDLELDLTLSAVIGLDVWKKYAALRRDFHRLLRLAFARVPDVIVLVDFSGFNRRFAHAIRKRLSQRSGTLNNWQPRIVQFVSPQVWASRERRAYQVARDYDLLLSIFPFEKEWYAKRVPEFRVAFVGHPMIDRYRHLPPPARSQTDPPVLVLLPGSRAGELQRHLPMLILAVEKILAEQKVIVRMVLSNEYLADLARPYLERHPEIEIRIGPVSETLPTATVALASTGTVTMECAYFGVPTVTFYKASWATYQIGKRIVKVPSLTMPNLLAGETIFPEFVQDSASPENIARAAIELLRDPARRSKAQLRLAQVIESLGPPGAAERAASEIVKLLGP